MNEEQIQDITILQEDLQDRVDEYMACGSNAGLIGARTALARVLYGVNSVLAMQAQDRLTGEDAHNRNCSPFCKGDHPPAPGEKSS